MHGSEADAVARAVPKRRREFATGRVLLRQLLGSDVAIDVLADRRPALPIGTVGSLAHTDTIAVAAVTDAETASALGIDVEPATHLDAAMARIILRADEHGTDAHLAFTVKEAVYKAWSSLGGRMLDHHDVRTVIHPDGAFVARADGTADFSGRWSRAAEHWIALVVVPRQLSAGTEHGPIVFRDPFRGA